MLVIICLAFLCVFPCLLFCFLLLYVHFRACLICCNDSVNYLACFAGKLCSFAVWVYAQVIAGATSSIWVSSYWCIHLFLCSHNILSPSHATCCFFSLLQLLLVFFARGTTVHVFATPNHCLHQFVLARLAFFPCCLQFSGFKFCNICIAVLCDPKLRTNPPLCPLWPLEHPLQLPAVFFP